MSETELSTLKLEIDAIRGKYIATMKELKSCKSDVAMKNKEIMSILSDKQLQRQYWCEAIGRQREIQTRLEAQIEKSRKMGLRIKHLSSEVATQTQKYGKSNFDFNALEQKVKIYLIYCSLTK